jgi:hypothetical protein
MSNAIDSAIFNLMTVQFLAKTAEDRIAGLPYYTHQNLEMLAMHETNDTVLAAIAKTMEAYQW